MAVDPNINTGNGNMKDVSDFANDISKMTASAITTSFRNIDDLMTDVSNKQKEYNKEIRDTEKNVLLANSNSARQKELATLTILQQQKKEVESLGKTLSDISNTEKEAGKAKLESEKSAQKIKSAESLGRLKDVAQVFGAQGLINFFTGGWFNAFVKSLEFIKDLLFANDEMQTKISRNLGIQKNQTFGILAAYRDMAASSGLQVGLAKDFIEAQSQITQQYNLQQPVSDEILVAQVQMTKEMGLQAQEASRLNSIFLLNGDQGRAGLDIVYKQVAEYANQNKILFSGKGILSEISKLSGQIRASFKGNTEEMAKSVLEASRLGTTLNQTRAMSESLLNFESSIDNELKAELLTGQQLNLEKARGLALSGKYVDAGKEMLEQAGGLNNFQKLNVIQQNALAAAVGLTSDQMADILFKQSETGKYANSLATKYEAIHQYDIAQRMKRGELTMEQLRTAELELTAQQKFEASMERVKEIFAGFVNNGILDRLANFAEVFTKRLATGSLAEAIFHNYSTDLAELDAKKLDTATGAALKEDTVGLLKGRAITAQALAKEDSGGFIQNKMIELADYLDSTKNYNEKKAEFEEMKTKKYYEEMITVLNKILTNPVPAQLSTSVLSQFMVDNKVKR